MTTTAAPLGSIGVPTSEGAGSGVEEIENVPPVEFAFPDPSIAQTVNVKLPSRGRCARP